MSTMRNNTYPSEKSNTSKQVAAAAVRLAISADREEERSLIEAFKQGGTRGAAADFGGEYLESVATIIERAVVAARREGVISLTHAEEGAIAGAAHEAATQLMSKAAGLSIGGKIGIARYEDHVCVCAFFAVGLLHLDEVAIGLGHRVI